MAPLLVGTLATSRFNRSTGQPANSGQHRSVSLLQVGDGLTGAVFRLAEGSRAGDLCPRDAGEDGEKRGRGW